MNKQINNYDYLITRVFYDDLKETILMVELWEIQHPLSLLYGNHHLSAELINPQLKKRSELIRMLKEGVEISILNTEISANILKKEVDRIVFSTDISFPSIRYEYVLYHNKLNNIVLTDINQLIKEKICLTIKTSDIKEDDLGSISWEYLIPPSSAFKIRT